MRRVRSTLPSAPSEISRKTAFRFNRPAYLAGERKTAGMRIAILVLAAGLAPLWAQEIKLPANVEKLAEKAEESVVVTLDSNMLRLFAKFDNNADAATKKVLAGLESIYVRSFQFAVEDEY